MRGIRFLLFEIIRVLVYQGPPTPILKNVQRSVLATTPGPEPVPTVLIKSVYLLMLGREANVCWNFTDRNSRKTFEFLVQHKNSLFMDLEVVIPGYVPNKAFLLKKNLSHFLFIKSLTILHSDLTEDVE